MLQPLSPCPLMSADPVPPYTRPSWRQLRLGLVHLASPVFYTQEQEKPALHRVMTHGLLLSAGKVLAQLLAWDSEPTGS